MLTFCIADAERDVGMKNLSPKEAITILESMKVDIPVPKAAITQIKRNVALNMAIDALLKRSEISNDSDTISRQDAIDALGEEPEVWSGNDEYAQGLNNQWHYDVNAIKAVPPAEPEITDVQAIEQLQASGWMQSHDKQMYEAGLKERLSDDGDSYDALLPPAQPEIIRCWECKHWGKRGLCDKWDNFIGNGDFYCGCAEMKEGGADG